LQTTFDDFVKPLRGLNTELPRDLEGDACHLDPDFEHLTFGDQGQRGGQIAQLEDGDLMAFFASFRPLEAQGRSLMYALIGLFVVDEIVLAKDVPRARWGENAHTRRLDPKNDIVVRAKAGRSGRLRRCLPIGEYRRRAYRVTTQLLETWGSLDIKDGFIQRSVRLPRFTDAKRFYSWFLAQGPELVAANN
jgi:hypothetical protein